MSYQSLHFPVTVNFCYLEHHTLALFFLPSKIITFSGARIQLASGEIKCVEELTEEDFRRSTELSPDLKLDCSTVGSIEIKANHLISLIRFVLEDDRLDVSHLY